MKEKGKTEKLKILIPKEIKEITRELNTYFRYFSYGQKFLEIQTNIEDKNDKLYFGVVSVSPTDSIGRPVANPITQKFEIKDIKDIDDAFNKYDEYAQITINTIHENIKKAQQAQQIVEASKNSKIVDPSGNVISMNKLLQKK